jgi:hypothetical protein
MMQLRRVRPPRIDSLFSFSVRTSVFVVVVAGESDRVGEEEEEASRKEAVEVRKQERMAPHRRV